MHVLFNLFTVKLLLMLLPGTPVQSHGSANSQPGACYRLTAVHAAVHGGHSPSCFLRRPLSFEACRLLLAMHSNCTYLSYSGGSCSLHSNLTDDFNLKYRSVSGLKQLVLLKERSLDTGGVGAGCSEEMPLEGSAVSYFRSCLHHSRLEAQIRTEHLPPLAIVLSVTEDWPLTRRAGFAAVVSNFQCYCDRHGYSFIVNKMKAVAPSEFFHTRHADVLHKYLPHFQQVMHIDADSLVLNIDRPLTVYLAASADVQLHLHESGEVTASNYIVKNSIYGKCFLRYWSRFRAGDELPFSLGSLRYETLNFDNGDLMAAVMNAVSPSAFASCMAEIGASEESTIRQYSNPYLELHVECWKRIFMDAYTNPTRHATEISEGLKIYLPRESYWRTFARKGRFGLWWDQLFGSCFEHSDIIGHGWKAMPRELWGGNHSCPAISGNNGHNEVCEWVSKALELELARKYCLWKSPVCLLDYSGTNKCIDDSSACSASGSLYSSLRATSMTEKKRKQVQLFNVGNEKWWRQQLCSWCPAEVPE